ncbi:MULTISPECIES: glycosyltransferase [Prochlorococcus]|uniref:glycosyltransferase n=1 Tax=Prochlorococcus TaxID=1218 RepID=UPI0007B349D8|nr:glycosyltransferase [Prochlorococcus marinus]NMP05915.1 glycosyltransferase [Prochlorococcus sp. P1361]
MYRQPLAWIQEAVASVQEQTYKDWQLLIRPDGPEGVGDDCRQWLKALALKEPRLQVLDDGLRQGTFGSYQLIFSQSEATYFVQLDADDKLHPEALALSIEYLNENPKAPFLYSQCLLVRADGSSLGLDQRALRPWQEEKKSDLVQFISFHMRVVRRSAYLKVNGYSKNFQFTGDYDLSLKLAELGKPLHLAKPLYNYRVHPQSVSQSKRLNIHLEAVRAARNALHRRGMVKDYVLIHNPKREIVTLDPKPEGPIVVAGMHRSGTSLLSKLISKLGVELGNELLAKDSNNPDGYQEDLAFLKLQRRWFHADLNDDPDGWRDWGWIPNDSISSQGDSSWEDAAVYLLNQRELAATQRWGWKDPRTTLILPFWHRLRPELRLVGIYRAPWDLSDALQRLDHHQFRRHPEIILPLWSLYNERLAEFAESHAERSLLINSNSLITQPEEVVRQLQSRWDWRLDNQDNREDLNTLIRPNRMPSISLDDPIEDLYRLVFPELMKIWDRLQTIADLPALSENNTNIASGKKSKQTNKEPDISVIIPTFNPCHFLLEAIASINRYASEDSEVEVIIVDDGSTKSSSQQILQRLKQGGYRILRIEHSGLAAARNHGIKAANAELIIPLDDDNRLLSPYLQECLSIIRQNPDMEMIFGDRLDFGARTQHFKPGILNAKQLVKANRIDACTLMKRSLWKKCGGYDENLKALEDWDLWLTGMQIGMRAIYHPKPCFEYRVRENSMLQCHLANENEHQKTINYLRAKHGLPIEALVE